jgi:hypothetical protein
MTNDQRRKNVEGRMGEFHFNGERRESVAIEMMTVALGRVFGDDVCPGRQTPLDLRFPPLLGQALPPFFYLVKSGLGLGWIGSGINGNVPLSSFAREISSRVVSCSRGRRKIRRGDY